jgi:mono/diheme cytochrome c family protein
LPAKKELHMTTLPAFDSRLQTSALPRALRQLAVAFASVSALGLAACSGPAAAAPEAVAPKGPHIAAASQIDAGRYLVKIGGCNDCHTVGFVETNGANPPESEWLTGSPMGYGGPWGVSYAANLRLAFQNMSEEQFLTLAHEGQGRPPMPWPSLMAMSDDDLRAIYAYIRYLGPKGEVAPAPVPPGQKPRTPYVPFVPVMPG